MRRVLSFSVVSILLLFSCNSIDNDVLKHQLLLNQRMDSTVQLFSEDGGRGSGVMIAQNRILTAYHVVGKVDIKMYTAYKGKYIEAKLILFNEELDIAVLELPFNFDLPIAPLAKDAPQLGDTVYSMGFHFGDTNLKLCTKGVVSQILDVDANTGFMFFDASINPGSSGGPIFNDKLEIIGINQMIFTTTGAWCGISLCNKFEIFKKFLANGLK